MVKTVNCHLRNTALVKKYLDKKTMKMLIYNHVISKLDYCNSLYYGQANYLLKKLQLVMNRMARLLKGLALHERTTAALTDLHWLPIKACLVFKMCNDLSRCQFWQTRIHEKPAAGFWRGYCGFIETAVINRLNEPRFNLELSFRAFEKCASRLYNDLPVHVKRSESIQTLVFVQIAPLKLVLLTLTVG